MIDLERWTSPRRVALLAGDLAVIALVLSLGVVHHRGVAGLLTAWGLAGTVAPFLVAWVVLAPLTGTYDDGVIADRRRSVLWGTGHWMGAAVLGAGLRATPAISGGATPIFVLVIAATGGVAIAAWRVLASGRLA